MNELILNIYVVLSVFIAITDIALAWESFRENNTTGKYLGHACLGAAVVDISYLVSILNDSYFCMSIMSSIYFASIDFMLVCLLLFTLHYTRHTFTDSLNTFIKIIAFYALFEAIVFAINPFYEIAVRYIPRNTLIARYSYEMLPLYWMHLIFSYTMVAVVLALLLHKLIKTPREYRGQYLYATIGIIVIVLVNAFFLFYPGENIANLLDYSICGYSLTSFLLYWSCFNYSTHGMLDQIKNIIFENVDQGLVLFDYDNKLILSNKKANFLLGDFDPEIDSSLHDFLKICNLSLNPKGDTIPQQCYIRDGEETRPLRCDIRRLNNDQDQTLGHLFVFSDAVLETDVLTGFQNWESFQRFITDTSDHFPYPTIIAICDINSLSVINSTHGTTVGDQKIRLLADTMREHFPEQTYFVRGHEANLIALCSYETEESIRKCLELVDVHFAGNIQYAVSSTSTEVPDILQAIHIASMTMRAKKLLDQESIHSDMLTSLIRALQECDSDTERHVRRTQEMGADLGERIDLNDAQQSKLSLLCLLHDIGKIGVPLEILNKPGKLTDAEWATLRAHAKKGYDIANSNSELKDLAKEILHHHERWDGKGYPDGLKGEDIPLLSRIIAVVDAYDAMTNDRSYRSALSVSAAVQELRKCAGSQFDPYIVSEFIIMLRDNPKYRIPAPIKSDTSSGTDTPIHVMPDSANKLSASVDALSPSTEEHYVHPIHYSHYVLDESQRIVSVDDNFEKLTGYSAQYVNENMLYQTDLIPEAERTEYLSTTNAYLAKSPIAFQEHKLLRKDGSIIYVFCYGRMYFDSAVRSTRCEIVIADITNTYAMKMMTYTEHSKAEAKLRYWEQIYRLDPLTGLLSHAAFRSDVELKQLEDNKSMMMLMIDIDNFKSFKEIHGSHESERYLLHIAQTLLSILRKQDRACRMGGDEFSVVLFFHKETTLQQIQERAQQICQTLNEAVKIIHEDCTISVGVAVTDPGRSFNQIYDKAAHALYRAKQNGRGKIVIDVQTDFL